MPRVKKFQVSEQTITNNKPHQLAINDNSTVNSRIMCRSDLMSNNRFEGISESPNVRFDLENTPLSTSAVGSITQSNHFNIPSLKNGNYLGIESEYDISKKLEDFVNSTPRTLSKLNLSETTAAR